MNIALGFLSTLAIIFIVPMLVYGVFSKYLAVAPPKEKGRFFLSVLIQKVGTSVGFVWLYSLLNKPEWLVYAAIWFIMFAIIEVGQALLPTYSKKEAIAGIISEAIYFPLAAYVLSLVVQ